MSDFKALGKKVISYQGLETFPAPRDIVSVTLISREVTSLCPVTGQPDWYTVKAIYQPRALCIESKTWKLFLQSFRNEGLFCEAFASRIMEELVKSVNPYSGEVEVTQRPRGGVAIVARAVYGLPGSR